VAEESDESRPAGKAAHRRIERGLFERVLGMDWVEVESGISSTSRTKRVIQGNLQRR
jgi:hypothetical protein